MGIINGTSATTFELGKNITRQQAAKKIADYAKVPFAELQAQNVMTGYNGYIEPGDTLTRSQMAKILKRALDLVAYDFK